MESVDGSATSALLTGLTPNVDYEASITASNCAGTSEPTAFSFRIQGTCEFIYQFLHAKLISTHVVPAGPIVNISRMCASEVNKLTVWWKVC